MQNGNITTNLYKPLANRFPKLVSLPKFRFAIENKYAHESAILTLQYNTYQKESVKWESDAYQTNVSARPVSAIRYL